MSSERIHGTLARWIEAKGFGFIQRDSAGGPDVFIGSRIFDAAGIDDPHVGIKLTFVVVEDRKGSGKTWAEDVAIEGGAAEAERAFKHEPVRP